MSKINQFTQINYVRNTKTNGYNKKDKFNENFKLNLIKEVNSSIAKIDNINENLENGDLNSVKELEKLGISYTQEEYKGGYRINYEYGDINYTIAYNEVKNNNNLNNKPISGKLDDEDYAIIQEMIEETNQENTEELLTLKPPVAPKFADYQNEDDYQLALDKYFKEVEEYDHKIAQLNKETNVLSYLSNILTEKQRYDNFNKNIENAINDIKQSGDRNSETAINQLKEYANDFKSKVEEKIYYTQQLQDCYNEFLNTEYPTPPQITSSTNEDEYQKEMVQYEADLAKYDMEVAASQFRLQIIEKKLKVLDALLETMYSSNYETSASLFYN